MISDRLCDMTHSAWVTVPGLSTAPVDRPYSAPGGGVVVCLDILSRQVQLETANFGGLFGKDDDVVAGEDRLSPR